MGTGTGLQTRRLLLALVFAGSLLANAGLIAGQDTGGSAMVAEPTRMVLWWPEQLAPAGNPAAIELLNSQLDAFQSLQGNVTLQLRLKANEGANGILATLRAASPVAPGVLPDLALMQRADMLVAARDGLIHPLEEGLSSRRAGRPVPGGAGPGPH